MTRPAAWLAKNVPLRLTASVAVEVVLGDVLGRVLRRDAGVVDQDVEPAERVHDGVDRRRDLLGPGDVHL